MNTWEPEYGPYEPEPEPCQYCSVMARVLKECDHSCDTLTKEKWIELNATSDPAPCLAIVRDNERFTTRCALPSGHEGAHQETP